MTPEAERRTAIHEAGHAVAGLLLGRSLGCTLFDGGGGGEAKLYRASHRTFEDYCRERWGMQRAYAYRLMESSEVVRNLSPMGDIPQSERQTRPLAKLPAEEQAHPCPATGGGFLWPGQVGWPGER